MWHAYFGNEKSIFVIWNANICKGLPCLKLSQAYLMKYWLGPTYLFKTTWTRKKCYALLHSVLTNNHGLIAVDGPWAVLYGLSLALCFHLIICGGEGVLICILIFIVVTCHMFSSVYHFVMFHWLYLVVAINMKQCNRLTRRQATPRKMVIFIWLQFSLVHFIWFLLLSGFHSIAKGALKSFWAPFDKRPGSLWIFHSPAPNTLQMLIMKIRFWIEFISFKGASGRHF